jgi:hypothetical protein
VIETIVLIGAGIGCIAFAAFKLKKQYHDELGPADAVYYTYYLPLVWTGKNKNRNDDPSVSVTLYIKDGRHKVSSSEQTNEDPLGLLNVQRFDPRAYSAIKAWLDGLMLDNSLISDSGHGRTTKGIFRKAK